MNLRYANDVLSTLRFEGPDQNPKGIRDIIGAAALRETVIPKTTTVLLDRLLNVECDHEPFTQMHAKCICQLADEAATEIIRLKNLLDEIEPLLGGFMGSLSGYRKVEAIRALIRDKAL